VAYGVGSEIRDSKSRARENDKGIRGYDITRIKIHQTTSGSGETKLKIDKKGKVDDDFWEDGFRLRVVS
jgi:hypothetical protein